MSQLIVSDALRAELERATGPVELRDKAGRKLGSYVPEPLVPWDPSITKEELDRRYRESGGRSLEEVLKRLSIQ